MEKLNFQQPLLQCSVSHESSEINDLFNISYQCVFFFDENKFYCHFWPKEKRIVHKIGFIFILHVFVHLFKVKCDLDTCEIHPSKPMDWWIIQ